MANHKSAEKSIRQIKRRASVNKSRLSSIRTMVKKVETMIKNANHKSAMESLKNLQSAITKGVNKGIVTKNAAARKISRMNAKVKKIAQ